MFNEKNEIMGDSIEEVNEAEIEAILAERDEAYYEEDKAVETTWAAIEAGEITDEDLEAARDFWREPKD